MTLEEQRLAAAERIRAVHRRAGDRAPATEVTVSEGGHDFDLVRVKYADGQVREFKRCREETAEGSKRSATTPSVRP